MPSQRALAALVVVVGIVALGAAAGGLDQPVGGPGQGESVDSVDQEPGEGSGSVGGGDMVGSDPADTWVAVPDWALQGVFLVMLGLGPLVGLLWAAYLYANGGLDGLKNVIEQTWDSILAMAIVLVGAYIVLWVGPGEFIFGNPPQSSPPDPGGGGPEVIPDSTSVVPMVILGGFFLVVGLVAVFHWRFFMNRDETVETERAGSRDPEPVGDPTMSVAQSPVAENEGPDNAVYRSWHRLARRAGVAHDRTRTPGEVADAAIEEGLQRDAVRTITNVFSEVRYGHQPVTDERERRAESALQSIEGSGGDA